MNFINFGYSLSRFNDHYLDNCWRLRIANNKENKVKKNEKKYRIYAYEIQIFTTREWNQIQNISKGQICILFIYRHNRNWISRSIFDQSKLWHWREQSYKLKDIMSEDNCGISTWTYWRDVRCVDIKKLILTIFG